MPAAFKNAFKPTSLNKMVSVQNHSCGHTDGAKSQNKVTGLGRKFSDREHTMCITP